MQLRHFVWVIQHWLWLILLGTILCAGATYVISKKAPPVYEASAVIQVNDVGSTDNSSVFNDQALAVSYALQITSSDVLQIVSRELPGVTEGELAASVSAAPLDNTQLIQVLADAHDPVQAATIANDVVTVFIQQQIAKQSAIDQRAAATLLQELVTAKANVDNAQAQLSKLVNSQATPDQITHQTDILDNFQVNYNTLFSSYNQIQLQENLISNSLSITQSATPPTTVKGHSTLLNTAIAAALGLLLTIVFALLLDWLDKTIKTPEDVAQLAMLEPLGSVPLSRDSADKARVNDADLERAFVTISTSFRVLSSGQRAILVTGLRSGVGTSTTASWLAQALAQSGMRILLVDANLQQPTQHNTFNILNTAGVTNSLSNCGVFQQSLAYKHTWLKRWSTGVPNLFLLPAGPEVSHVETIQIAAKLQVLTAWLLQHDDTSSSEQVSGAIDMIIFDAPALEEGASTIALAPVTDSTVLVIEAGKERSEALEKAQATLQRLGSPITGVVVNRQRAKHRSYAYTNHPQQATVFTESLHTRSASKYAAVAQTGRMSYKELPETPLPVHEPRTIGAPVSDDTVRVPRSIMAITHALDAAKENGANTSDAALAYPVPSQTNGFWSGDNQGEQL